MKVQFTFTPTTRFDSISIGEVFLVCGDLPYMKIQEVQIESDFLGCPEILPFNAVSLRSGELDWFDMDNQVVPCPSATLSF